MGYRDAWPTSRLCRPKAWSSARGGTAMEEPPLGARFTVRGEGRLGVDRVEVHLVGEVTDLEGFAAAPERGTTLVGWLRHPRWGPVPLEDGRFRVGSSPDGGRRFAAVGRLATPDGPLVLRVTCALPVSKRLAPLRSVGLDLALQEPDGSPIAGGRVRLSPGDLVRLALSFEPSGAHNLADRWSALCQTARFLHRR